MGELVLLGAGTSDETLLANIGLAQNELNRRLAAPELAAKMSDSTLLRVVVELTKLHDRPSADEGGNRGKTTNILALVQQPGLPIDRQINLVQRALEQAKLAGEPTDSFEAALRKIAPDHQFVIEGGTNGASS